MRCPRDDAQCETYEHASGVELDRCPACGGVWADRGELESVRAKVEADYDMGRLTPPEDFDFAFSRDIQGRFGTIRCPRCGATMDTKEYAYWSQVLVDVCPKGCGVWLDADELRAIEVFFARERAEEKKVEAGQAVWGSLTEMFGG